MSAYRDFDAPRPEVSLAAPRSCEVAATATGGCVEDGTRTRGARCEAEATVDLAVDGIIAKDELRERLAKLDNEARGLRALLPAPAPAADSRRVIESLARAFTEFGLLPFADKRNLLARVFREFVIEGGGISSATLSGAFLADETSTKVDSHTASGRGSHKLIQYHES